MWLPAGVQIHLSLIRPETLPPERYVLTHIAGSDGQDDEQDDSDEDDDAVDVSV